MYLLATGATAKSEAKKIALVITLGGAELGESCREWDP